MKARKAKGLKTYGTVLTTNNGRDAMWDAIEEAADLLNYLVQGYIEVRGATAFEKALKEGNRSPRPHGKGSPGKRRR